MLAILRCEDMLGVVWERVGAGLNPQNEGMLAWYEIPDGNFEDMAGCYGGDHFNWFQQVVEPDGFGVRADGTALTSPFVDPPLGGFGDDPQTPGDDSLWADNKLPYWNEQEAPPGASGNHAFFRLDRHTGPHPVFGSPNLEMIDFPSRPTSVGSVLKFETYLTVVDLQANIVKNLYMIEWTWAKSAGSDDSLAALVRIASFGDEVLFDPDSPAPPAEQLTWEFVGMGLGEIIATPNGNQAARLVSNDSMSFTAEFDTPAVGAFNLAFDHWFQTTDGTLEVLLNNQVIHSISAPSVTPSDFAPDSALAYELDLRGLQAVDLEFRLTGTNSEVWIDNVILTSVVPEPTFAIAILLGAFLCRRAEVRLLRCRGQAADETNDSPLGPCLHNHNHTMMRRGSR